MENWQGRPRRWRCSSNSINNPIQISRKDRAYKCYCPSVGLGPVDRSWEDDRRHGRLLYQSKYRYLPLLFRVLGGSFLVLFHVSVFVRFHCITFLYSIGLHARKSSQTQKRYSFSDPFSWRSYDRELKVILLSITDDLIHHSKLLENKPSATFWTSLSRSLEKYTRDSSKSRFKPPHDQQRSPYIST